MTTVFLNPLIWGGRKRETGGGRKGVGIEGTGGRIGKMHGTGERKGPGREGSGKRKKGKGLFPLHPRSTDPVYNPNFEKILQLRNS